MKIVPKIQELSISRALTRRVMFLSFIAGLGVILVMVLAFIATLESAEANMQENGIESVSTLDLFLLNLESDMLATSSSVASSSDVRATLLQMRIRHPEILDVLLLDEEGNVIAQRSSIGRPHTENIQDTPWQPILDDNLDGIYISPLIFDDQIAYLEMAATATDDIGLPVGTLLIRIDLTDLWTSTINLRIGQTGYVYIASHDGQIIAYRNRSLITKGNSLAEHIGRLPDELASTDHNYYRGLNGRYVLGKAYPMTSTDWYVVVEQPVAESLDKFLMTMVVLIALLAMVAVLLININIFVHRRITVPLQSFSQAVQEIESGNLNTHLELPHQDELGQLGGLFNKMSDRLQEVLANLRHEADRVQQIINTVPEGVVLLDQSFAVVSANPSGQAILAMLAETKIGDTLNQLGDQSLADLLQPPPLGQWHEIDAQTSPKKLFEAIAQPIERGPIPGGWVLVMRDVTQEREQQTRLQNQVRLASIGQLAAGIAHDFNNILAVISLRADIINRTEDHLSDVARERLQTILNQTQHAAELIGQILDFSRQSVMKRQPLALNSVLKEQIKLFERILPENIHIEFHPTAEPCFALADPTRIQQVTMNLAINARDAMPDGGQLILTTARLSLDEQQAAYLGLDAGEWIEWRTTDTGSGIPPDILDKVFEPFVTTKAPGSGTGLGLSQVYGIVKQHNGHIEIKSVMDKGVTVIIYLPAIVRENARSTGEHPSGLPHGTGETILLVEDEENIRTALREILENLGYRVIIARNGKQGLHLWIEHKASIALVLSDIVMPEMSGLELFAKLIVLDPQVKCILMTGHILDSVDLPHLKFHGLGDLIQKPPRIDTIAQAIRNLLDEPQQDPQ